MWGLLASWCLFCWAEVAALGKIVKLGARPVRMVIMVQADNASIIVLDKFVQATRDSGYRGTVSAIAELVDNSIQAEATDIRINVTSCVDGGDWPIEISVLDNGTGMDRSTLRQSLRFGGSTRFNDRRGLGRY